MKKIFLFLAACAMSIGAFAASITASDVDFGTISLKGQTLPVTGSEEVHVTFSGLANYSSLMAEVIEGDDNFYLEVYSIYYGTGSSVDYPVYYYLETAGTFTGKVRFYGYDSSSNEFEKVINVKVVATDDAEVAKTTPFERVNSIGDLAAGDVVVFVCEAAGAVGGPLNGTYLPAITENVSINASAGTAEIPETAQTFTMSKSGDFWQFTNPETSQKLLSDVSGKGAFAYGTPSSTLLDKWSISISSGKASVENENEEFPVEFNSDRFKPYKTAQGSTYQLYKKAGEAHEVEATLAINPTTINFGDVARSATKAIEIAYTAEHLTDDIVWGIEGADAALFEVSDSGNRTSGTVTITYKGTATKSGSVNAQLAYLTADAKMDPMEGSFPININLLALTGISFKESSYAVLKGENKDLSGEVVFDPADVSNKGLTWKLEGSAYFASITSAGIFSATATGDYVVVATSVLDENVQAKCTVNVSLPVPASIELGATEHEMNIGDTWTLTAAVKPDGTEKKALFASDNTGVATVNKNGVITAVAEGTAVITVSAEDYPDVKNTCTISVVKRTVESIAFANAEVSLNLGSTLQLNPTVTPAAAASEYTISYVSGNEEVATVDENGKVTSVAVGDAVITATISDKSAEITIHVVAPAMFAKVTDPSELAAKDTIILALKSANIIAGPRSNKQLTVLSEGVTITETEAFADNACRIVLDTEKNKTGFTLTIVGASKPLAAGTSGTDIIDGNTTNYKFWQFVADANGVYIQNTQREAAIFKYYASNNAIKLYAAAGAEAMYVYVRKYVDPSQTEGIEDVTDGTKAQKVLRDGQIFIIRNGETYSITGVKVE